MGYSFILAFAKYAIHLHGVVAGQNATTAIVQLDLLSPPQVQRKAITVDRSWGTVGLAAIENIPSAACVLAISQ